MAPEAGPTVTAAATVVENTSATTVVPNSTAGLVRRPSSLNSAAIGGANSTGTGSLVTSPTSGSVGITASLRPVSAPFLHLQTSTSPTTTSNALATEASNDRLGSASTTATTTRKNDEGTNNEDKGERSQGMGSGSVKLCFGIIVEFLS